MIKSTRFCLALICAVLLNVFPAMTLADGSVDNEALAETADTIQNRVPCSYGRKINEKGLRTVANLLLSLPELPKGIINVTNDSNIFFGLTGGLLKGVINVTGRLATGVVDLATLPIPTKPIAYPLYAWEDFEQETRYDSLFRLDRCPEEAVVAVPNRAETNPQPAAVITPPRQVIDSNNGYRGQTDQKIDALFQERMMK